MAKYKVYNAVNRFNEILAEDLNKSGRPCTAHSKKIVTAFQESGRRTPKICANQLKI